MKIPANEWAAILALALAAMGCGERPPENPVSAPPGSGRIVLDEVRHDYGTMDQGQEVTHVFLIGNKGRGVLRLLGTTTTCGCAAMVLDAKRVLPGGTARLEVTFRSSSFVGAVEKHVFVQSDDPRQPQATLTLRAKVQPAYVIEPPVVNLGEIQRGTGAVREIVVRNAKGRPFGVNSVTVSNDDLKSELSPNDGGQHPEYRVRVTLDPKRNVGPFNLLVMLQTDRVEFPRPIILVSGTVTGPVLVRPQAVFLGQVWPGKPFQPKTVTVSNTGPTPIAIESVDTGDERITATVKTNATGREFQIEVAAGPMSLGWFQRTLRIRASDSATPLEVPMNGVALKDPQGAAQ